MRITLTAPEAREALATIADTVSKKGDTYTARRGFFYTNGTTSQALADAVLAEFPRATILNHGEVWKDFKGGAPTAQQSHWWVTFTLPAQPQIEAYGYKGAASTSWRRTFRTAAALHAWCERNDAQVLGSRSDDY